MSTEASLTTDFDLLPNDFQLLKQMIADLMVELSKKDGRIEQLQHRMDLLLRRLYGASSEKFDPRQGSLFETTPEEPSTAEPVADIPPAAEADAGRQASSRSGHGRRKLPETLKTVEVLHDLTEAEIAAMGGADNLVCIGQEETEQVEWEPSCLYRILHIQKKYARKVQLPESGLSLSEKNVLLARKPPQPIEGGLPGPQLLAQLATCKFMDHIPLYRFERISELYRIERELRERCSGPWKELAWSERCQLVAGERTARSLPILLELQTWLQQQVPQLNPQHPWRKAAEYALGEWECLVAYVRDGALDIDNNVAERSLRGIALGRRNWLFVGSEQGGHTAALYFSLMATCQRRGIEPFAYLSRVFRELPKLLEQSGGKPSAEQLLTLLP